jgi:hypothetical protein
VREVTASQPANPHTTTAAAGATAPHPFGAKGVRLSRSACGSATTVARVSSPASSTAIASCTRPEIRTPNQLSTATPAMMTPAAHIVVLRDPPTRSAT